MDHNELYEKADELTKLGWRLTLGVTVPIMLFIVGLFIMPLGLALWAVGAIMFLIVNSETIEKYANSKREENEKNQARSS